MEEQKNEDNYIMRSFIMFTLYHRSIMSFTYIAYLRSTVGIFGGTLQLNGKTKK